MIPFQCPFCHQTIEVPDSRLGELEKCPTCGNTCQITRPRSTRSRAATIRAARRPDPAARQAKTSRGVMIGFFLLGGISLMVGLLMNASGVRDQALVPVVISVLLLVIALGCVPGSIARQRRLANADGLAVMGLLGILIPIIWLVALVMALAGTPQPARSVATARRPCPVCGESIPVAARKCRFCGTVL